MVESNRLVQALARLSKAATADFAVDDMLRELCEVAGTALAVDGVGVMGTDGDLVRRPRGRYVHSDQVAVTVEKLQEALQQGPCREAMDAGAVVVIPDISTCADRWPQFVPVAQESQLSAVVAVPLMSRGRTWGALDLYRRLPGAWGEAEVATAQLLGDVAVSYVVMAHDRDVARLAQLELRHRTLHDPLTGLANRVLLYDRLSHALATAQRRAPSR